MPCVGDHCLQCSQPRKSRVAVKTAKFPYIVKRTGDGGPTVLYITGLHEPVKDSGECNSDVHMKSMVETEAFVWGFEKWKTSQDLPVNLVVIDTCNSKIRTMKALSQILLEETTSVVSVVSALGRQETAMVAKLLEPFNISIITVRSVSQELVSQPKVFQVPIASNTYLKAMVSVLRYLGWTYVTVAYNQTDVDSAEKLKLLEPLANQAQICLDVIQVDSAEINVVKELSSSSKRGSHAVVFLLNKDNARVLLSAIVDTRFTIDSWRNKLVYFLFGTEEELGILMDEFGQEIINVVGFR